MMTVVTDSQVQFYREWLMSRGKFEPPEFGVNMSKDDFDDLMVEEFHGAYRDTWSIDELLLHPREASRFCDDVRRKHGFFNLPDDIILRVILGRRKHP